MHLPLAPCSSALPGWGPGHWDPQPRPPLLERAASKVATAISLRWDRPGTELGAVAWASLMCSLLVLAYKFTSLSPQGIRLLDSVAAWFKAVYISYLMLISSLLYIPITKMIVSVWICDTKQCSVLKVALWQWPSSAPVPPQGAPGGPRAARHSQGGPRPLGPQPRPQLLELAAPKAADFAAFVRVGLARVR